MLWQQLVALQWKVYARTETVRVLHVIASRDRHGARAKMQIMIPLVVVVFQHAFVNTQSLYYR